MLFYLVGIKGSGLSALAKILIDNGHIVYGVDESTSFYTEKNLNAKIEAFDKMILKKSYFYIIGNAYTNHSVSKYIKLMKYYYMSYPQFIAYYFKNYNFISVCGSHGKTTTTKLLSEFVKDSSCLIGDGTGKGSISNNFIIESCEYKSTFLNYYPNITLLLNIDYDHADYYKSNSEYIEAFKIFTRQSKIVIANGDDDNIKKIINDRFITFGLNDDNDITFSYSNGTIYLLGEEYRLSVIGLHYAYDFVGAYIVAKLLGAENEFIKNKLAYFNLPKRRLESFKINNCDCILDYAHHPTEIKCVYNTLSEMYSNKKIVCCFQPHTISRTKAFLKGFKEALSLFSDIYLLPIFTSVRELKNDVEENELYSYLGFKKINNISEIEYNENNLYAFLGAGDIDNMVKKLIK